MNEILAFICGGLIGVYATIMFIAHLDASPMAVEHRAAEKHCQAVESRHEFAKCVEEFKK